MTPTWSALLLLPRDAGHCIDRFASQLQTMLNSPQFLQQMSTLMSNPAIIDQIVASNPELAAMGPRVREVLQSDAFRELLYDPTSSPRMHTL